MPENGAIFSDGMENDYLQFNSGIEAIITVAEKKAIWLFNTGMGFVFD